MFALLIFGRSFLWHSLQAPSLNHQAVMHTRDHRSEAAAAAVTDCQHRSEDQASVVDSLQEVADTRQVTLQSVVAVTHREAVTHQEEVDTLQEVRKEEHKSVK